MPDDTGSKWTPADVRGLVNDVLKWALLLYSLYLGVDAKVDATKARADAAHVRLMLGQAK